MCTVVYAKVPEDALIHDPLCASLAYAARSYQFETDPYVLELREQDDERSRRQLAQVMSKRKTYCCDQLRAMDLRARSLREHLGEAMASWYISKCIHRFRQGLASTEIVLPELNENEKAHLNAIFFEVEQGCLERASAFATSDTYSISEKARRLVETLMENSSSSTRAIVFVEQRVHVTALTELLQRTPELQPHYRIGGFVGTSTNTSRKITVADLVEIKEQQKDLDGFRIGTKNLMIATNVLEEGIDISACNLVGIVPGCPACILLTSIPGRVLRPSQESGLFCAATWPSTSEGLQAFSLRLQGRDAKVRKAVGSARGGDEALVHG